MAKVLTFLFLNLIYHVTVMAQNFAPLPQLDNGWYFNYIDRVLVDPVHDKLLVSSKTMNYAGIKKVRGICSWNGTVWDSLTSGLNSHDPADIVPDGVILGGIPYGGQFLVGGGFQSVGGVNATNLATWDGIKWDSLPTRAFKFLDYGGFVYDLINFQNKLYIGGNYDTIANQKANGLATFDGSFFNPVNAPISSPAAIVDMKIFNNDLYISGILTYTGEAGNENILRFDGNSWFSVGGGIKGSTSSVASMVVYHNELYVGGYFLKAAGNAADIIMKWDGTNWHDVNWGNEYQNGGIWKLLVQNNKLYAFGTFDVAGDKKASKVAVYDGSVWCTYSDSLDEGINSAASYHDTIYIAGGFKSIAGNNAMKYIAKFSTPNNYSECNTVGLKTIMINNVNIAAFPNPATDHFTLQFEAPITLDLKLFNAFGSLVLAKKEIQSLEKIDISHLSSGVYFVNVSNNSDQKTLKLLKQ